MNDSLLVRSHRISPSSLSSLHLRLLTSSRTIGSRTSPLPLPLHSDGSNSPSSNPGPSSHGTQPSQVSQATGRISPTPLSVESQDPQDSNGTSIEPTPGTSGDRLQPSKVLMDDTFLLESDMSEDEDTPANVVVTPPSQPSTSRGVCCFCYEDPPIAAYNRCGHRCVCEACFKRLFDGSNAGDRVRCYICRQYSDAVIQIFDA